MELIDKISRGTGWTKSVVEKFLDQITDENRQKMYEHLKWHVFDGAAWDSFKDELGAELDDLGDDEPLDEAIETFIAALAKGGDVKLSQDLQLPDAKTIIMKKTTTSLNLNKKTITGNTEPKKDENGKTLYGDMLSVASSTKATISNGELHDTYILEDESITPGGTLVVNGSCDITLKDMKITGIYPVWMMGKNSNLTIESGEYASTDSTVVYVYGADSKVTIKGGTFTTPDWNGKNYCLNVKDGLLTADKKATDFIEVFGGKFIGFNPAANAEKEPFTSFVAEGYKSIEIEPNVWEVIKDDELNVEEPPIEDLVEEVIDNSTIEVEENTKA